MKTTKNDYKIKWQNVYLLLFCLSIVNLAFAQDWPRGLHDPSNIVKDGDRYWIFATGDGIHAMYSYDLITWQDGPSPFTKTEFPNWINSYVKGGTNAQGDPAFHGGFWAPDIIKMNGRYYLYYSCSEWGTMTSTIGCVSTISLNPESPDYGWVDAGFLGIWSYQPGLALNAIDPALMRGPDNKIWMTYGSFNERGMVVAEVDLRTGKPFDYSGNLPGVTVANSFTGPNANDYGEGEGATMIYRNGYYYLFYNKGGCCNGIASSYYVVMGRSTSPKGPFVDKEGKPLVTYGNASGGTLFFKHDDSRGLEDRYYGPGHIGVFSEGGVDYVSFHYYDPTGYYPSEAANNMGGPTLGFGKLDWGNDGWPSLSFDFLEEGTYTLKNVNSNKLLDVENHDVAQNALLWQYDEDIAQDSQKWIFTPLGTGEYTIQNAKNKDYYLEAVDGSTNGDVLRLTNNYTGAINQKFRVVKSPVNDKIIIYPSIQNTMLEIPYAVTDNAQVKLYQNTNNDCQRWYASLVLEDPVVSLNATATESEIYLNWTLEKGVATTYELYRDTDSNPSGRTKLANISSVATTNYTDVTAVTGTTYYYWIKTNGAFNSNAASATIEEIVPEVNLSAEANDNAITLYWDANFTPSSYQVYRDTDSNPSGRVRIAQLGNTVTSYQDSTADVGVTYYYWIKTNSGLNSNVASATMLQQNDSVNLTANSGTDAIYLNWSTNFSPYAIEVYRDTDANPSGRVRIASLAATNTSYVDDTANENTTYYYWIKANGSINSNTANAAITSEIVAPNPVATRIEDTDIGTVSFNGALKSYGNASNGTAINLSNNSGQQIIWNYNAAYSGVHTVTIRYTRKSSMNPSVNMSYSGNSEILMLPVTESSEFATVDFQVTLNAGNNEIILTTNASGESADIDWIEVSGTTTAKGGNSKTKMTSEEIVSQVYPNPVKTELFVVGDLPLLGIEIYDTTGKLIQAFTPENTHGFKLDFSKFQSGIYHLKLISARGISFKRIIKIGE